MTGFADRRLHMVGIGGAGMSALAAIAYAWGAEVDGCDTARVGVHPPARAVRDPDLASGTTAPTSRTGMDVVVSSAVPR